MVFSSLIFIFVFLPLFFFFYFIKKNIKYRNFILLMFSLFFYAWGEPVYILLMLFSIFVNFIMTKFIDTTRSKFLFILTIAFNIGLLLAFKYTDFFIASANNVFELNIPFTNIALPIGISFYTFQIMTYVIDVYRRKVPIQNSIINLGCYVSAFPQLIAGPIVTYDTINDELDYRKSNLKDFSYGIKRFIIGLAKKVLIANQVAFIADNVFNNYSSDFGFALTFIGVLAYTIQIYYDFSGYSDMAIGLGRIMGFKYLENFNYPYIATSITDFWRRWHISLSTFFKDYVYIPLGGNRVNIFKHIRNILIVWFLTGMWHGASITFIIWGLYYGIILIIEKYLLKEFLKKCPRFIKHIYALTLIMISWIIFRADSIDHLTSILSSFTGLNGMGSLSSLNYLGIFQTKYIIAIGLGIIFSIPWKNKIKIKNDYLKNLTLIILFLVTIWFILVDTYNPFIYYRF